MLFYLTSSSVLIPSLSSFFHLSNSSSFCLPNLLTFHFFSTFKLLIFLSSFSRPFSAFTTSSSSSTHSVCYLLPALPSSPGRSINPTSSNLPPFFSQLQPIHNHPILFSSPTSLTFPAARLTPLQVSGKPSVRHTKWGLSVARPREELTGLTRVTTNFRLNRVVRGERWRGRLRGRDGRRD